MNKKLEQMMREVKNSNRTQSYPNRKNYEQNTSRIETPECTNDKDGETNAFDTDNQESEIQDNPFRLSGTNELRSPVQPIFNHNFDLDD